MMWNQTRDHSNKCSRYKVEDPQEEVDYRSKKEERDKEKEEPQTASYYKQKTSKNQTTHL